MDDLKDIISCNLVKRWHEQHAGRRIIFLRWIHPQSFRVDACPQICRGLKRAPDFIFQQEQGVMMPDNNKVSCKLWGGVHMSMKVSDTIKNCSISWLELGIDKISFDTNVMVARKNLQGDSTAKRIENPGNS